MENKLLYFHFYIGNKEVTLHVAGPDGTVLGQAASPLNFEDNLFSALHVLHRLMTSGGSRSSYQPNREFIRKIGRIQASLLNITAPNQAGPVDVQQLFEQHWNNIPGDAQHRVCFTFDFAQQAPYTELAGLPWEFLSYQDQDLAMRNNPGCDFIRKIAVPAPPPPPAPIASGEPLQILLIISEPEPDAVRQSGKSLVAYRESYVYRLLRIYENMANAQQDIRLRVLFQPRPAEIQQAQLPRKAVAFSEFLQWFQKNMVEPDSNPIRGSDNPDFQPHIVHFTGHLTLDEREEEIVGCINDENGLAYTPFQTFAACFAATPPQLLILQSPEGVQLHRGPFTQSGLLVELAQKRLPYILSFQHPLNEQGSLAFLRELYQRLFAAQDVPLAVSGARARLGRDAGTAAEVNAFGSPTLYSTLPQTGSIHFSLIAGNSGQQAPGEAGDMSTVVEKMSLTEKIEWYKKKIQAHISASNLELGLNQFKEIVLIALRSPDSDMAAAESYHNQVIILLNRFNDAKKAYATGNIDYNALSRENRSIGNALLEYLLPGAFPAVAKKTVDSDRPHLVAPKARPKSEDKIDAPR